MMSLSDDLFRDMKFLELSFDMRAFEVLRPARLFQYESHLFCIQDSIHCLWMKVPIGRVVIRCTSLVAEPMFASRSASSFPGIFECPGIHSTLKLFFWPIVFSLSW